MNIATKIVLAALVMVGLTVYQLLDWVISELKPRYREAMEESLVDTAYVLAAAIGAERLDAAPLERALAGIRNTRLDAAIYELRKREIDLRVSLTDAEGIVHFDSYEPANVGKDFSQWRNIALTMRGEYGARTTRDDPANPVTTVLYVSAPIRSPAGVLIGVLTVAKPTLSATYFIDSARRRLMRSGAVMLLVMLGLAVIVSQFIAQPLNRLTDYARAVGEGIPAKLPPVGKGEVGRLAAAFEQMRISLEGKRYVEQYIQTLTHELKSPLAAISGAAELLAEPGMTEEKRRHFLGNIQTEAARIRSLIERLLELSALEAKHSPLAREPVDLVLLCRELIDSFRPRLEQLGLECTLDAACQATVNGDAFYLRQSVSNLLDNAIEFSQPGGKIEISVSAGPEGVKLSVADNGPGIPEYARSRVRERFFSLPRPATNRKSSGLGLTLVEEVMKLHRGSLILENNLPTGTKATLQIPTFELAAS